MDATLTPPALPPHSGDAAMARAQERVAEPAAAAGMVALMALMWLAGWLVLSPLWAGNAVGPTLRDAAGTVFAPLPVTTRLPQILIAEPSEKVAEDGSMTAWEDTRHQAEYVAGALVEDEVQGVLLKLHLLAETGKFVGRMVSEK